MLHSLKLVHQAGEFAVSKDDDGVGQLGVTASE